jgi:ABC-type nitrate/sulfonate/bicarbonate transport system substrate-binding protein
MASMWMAQETGAFAKEGLDVEMISMSSTLALPALLANEVDAIQISAVPLINASLRGFDPVFVAGMLNTMVWDLYARPEIKSPSS